MLLGGMGWESLGERERRWSYSGLVEWDVCERIGSGGFGFLYLFVGEACLLTCLST